MKKIGILTFCQNNYGAVLQAFALQHFLRSNSKHDIEIIDFTTDYHLECNKIFNISESSSLLKYILLFFKVLRYFQLKKRKLRIESFKKQYINFSKRYSTSEEILHHPPIKDVYITGSDQVFNPSGKYVPVYYMSFNKNGGRKVAYAPSFGISNFNIKLKNNISGYLKDFDALSCREKIGAEFLSSIIGKTVPTVVDPTLLLTKDEWNSIAIDPCYKQSYIFIYDLNGGDNLVKLANLIKNITGHKIVCLTNKVYKFYKVDKQIYDAGPREFLGWIANAAYVVTDSFHGSVFSILFEKQFYSYVATQATSSRLMNLLSSYSLLDRLCYSNNCAINLDNVINYPLCENKDISDSYNFIIDNIIN